MVIVKMGTIRTTDKEKKNKKKRKKDSSVERSHPRISQEDGQQLLEKRRTAIENVMTRIHIHLHPSSLLDVDLGVREHINSLLLVYNESLDGIPIAYRDVTRVSDTSRISPYFPLCDVCVAVTFTVIRPQKGMILVGTVTEVSDTFISVLVFNLLNCVIPIGNIDEFSYSIVEQKWIHQRDASHTIGQGDDVRIRVESIENHGGGYITVVASLPAAGSKESPSLMCGNIACSVVLLEPPRESGGKSRRKKEKKEKKEKRRKEKQ